MRAAFGVKVSERDLPSSVRHPASHLRAGVFAKPASMPVYQVEAAMSRLNLAAKTLQIPLSPHGA